MSTQKYIYVYKNKFLKVLCHSYWYIDRGSRNTEQQSLSVISSFKLCKDGRFTYRNKRGSLLCKQYMYTRENVFL